MSSDSAHNPHAAPNSMPTILLIENDPTTQLLTTQTLRDANYRCVCVTTVDDAWEALQNGPIDVVVSDLHLGALADALALLARMRAHPDYREIPVVIASGDRSKETIRTAMGAGAAHYLVKPFPQSDLLASIRQCLMAKQA